MVSSTDGWTDVHLLEAALEGGVLLDVLAVLVEGGGADHAQLAAGQQRLDHVAGVHRPLGRAGADDRVQLVDEGDDLALGVGDLLEDGLEPLLELAPVLGPGDHADPRSSEMSRWFFRLSGTSPSTMRRARPSTMAVLPTPGSPMRTGLFLVRRDRTWMTAADLLVAADDRVELALAGVLGQVAAVLLERLVLVLGVLAGDPVAAPHLLQGGEQVVPGDPDPVGQGQQQVLGGQVLVGELVPRGVGGVEHRSELARRTGPRSRSCAAAWPAPPGPGCAAPAAGGPPSAGWAARRPRPGPAGRPAGGRG